MHSTDRCFGSSVAVCAVAVAASLAGPEAVHAAEAGALARIESYCAASWKNARIPQQDWADCTQETFVRLLDRVARRDLIQAIVDAESRERRELNRSIWCVVQKWRRTPRHHALSSEDVPARDEQHHTPAAERIGEIREALQCPNSPCTPRQRRIVTKWLSGESIARIAGDLGISAGRASDEKYKALQMLRSSAIEGGTPS